VGYREILTRQATAADAGVTAPGSNVEAPNLRAEVADTCGAETSVISLIREAAANAPSAVAVTFGAQTITYAKLDSRSHNLAVQLRSLGVARGAVIGLLAGRSVAYVIGALGIMKSGAAYLPMQPGDPKRRVNYQLHDAGAELIVAGESWGGRGEVAVRKIVRLAEDGSLEVNAAGGQDWNAVAAEDLAYVVYTSGSSGRPKGVEITHGSLLHLIKWHRTAFGVTAADRASLVSNVGVDAAAWELWPYLAAGASAHIADDAVAKNPEALRDWLIAAKISIAFAPTLVAERLMELEWPSKTDLRFLLTGGDVLHAYPPRNLPFQVVNNYGPTECTVVATSATMEPRGTRKGLPPIGRAIANAQIYILDAEMRSVPRGEVGEIWIGGAGVARGYRNQPELTAERFMHDPFVHQSGARLYRTGDRGGMLPDGQIVFLGRSDEQIKVRGFRVEPAEIEAALNQHPAVAQSSVNLMAVACGEERLVAHVVLGSDSAASAGNLQSFLRELLPEHMIPSQFVQLRELPVLPSGKIDRSALGAPSALNTIADPPGNLARTITEKRLQEIVSSLLKARNVCVHDNFFMLGGHSLLAAQLIARVRETFGIEMGLRFLFEYPTIAAIAAEIERLVRLKVELMTDEEAQQALAAGFAAAREDA
jgi:amino acid adenylation domain-containing protein